MSLVAIRSKTCGKWVSLNGHGVNRYFSEGGGSVGLQPHVQSWEIFTLRDLGNGTVAFESTAFPNVYLRLDGTHIKPGTGYPGGAGKVNGQFGLGHWEQFTIKRRNDSVHLGIESKEFPERFLRGSGDTVNGQGVWGGDEEFEIQVLSG
jgi:hypothetical protein